MEACTECGVGRGKGGLGSQILQGWRKRKGAATEDASTEQDETTSLAKRATLQTMAEECAMEAATFLVRREAAWAEAKAEGAKKEGTEDQGEQEEATSQSTMETAGGGEEQGERLYLGLIFTSELLGESGPKQKRVRVGLCVTELGPLSSPIPEERAECESACCSGL